MKTILLTGGAGFIGSALVNFLVLDRKAKVVNLDLLTYAGHLENLTQVVGADNYSFVHGDINDASLVDELFKRHQPQAVIHLAAESHVDRSILSAGPFFQTNLMGTLSLMEAALHYWRGLASEKAADFRFIMVSTDEVYGSLGPEDEPFTEQTAYGPRSPYSASKAGADHLAASFFHTHGFPVITSHCSNNYGPRQFPEKLVPLMILSALEGKNLPLYGDGRNIRDWLEVTDHVKGLWAALNLGQPGQVYNFGGEAQYTNKDLVELVCALLDEIKPASPFKPHKKLITQVPDRPGHDKRYAVNITKAKTELNWAPEIDLPNGLKNTINWYLENTSWLRAIKSSDYQKWLEVQYGDKK